MTRRILPIAFMLSLVFASTLLHAQAAVPASSAAAVPAKTAQPAHTAVQQDPGDRVYQANCARCHSAPEELSPRIAPTIVMHMRVRANLSAKDQQLLLKYLAP